jgi:hypothetical protein
VWEVLFRCNGQATSLLMHLRCQSAFMTQQRDRGDILHLSQRDETRSRGRGDVDVGGPPPGDNLAHNLHKGFRH